MTVVEQTSEVASALQAMIRDVKEGKWCRDDVDDHKGHHCALGLIRVECGYTPLNNEVIDVLDRCIPLHALEGRERYGVVVNGGTSRGVESNRQRVATFNNTVRDQSEIIQWFERALKEEK